MPRKNQQHASRKYHDRVARQYDSMYDDAFWEFHDRVTWNHLKHFFPKDPAAAVMDLGCGTGKWGLKLLKAGFPTTFSDLSNNMLLEVRQKLDAWAEHADMAAKVAKATVQQADATDLRAFPADHFSLVVAMGDVVSICPNPAKCLSEVHRLLKPGGVFVFTVDNSLAAIDHFVTTGNLDAMSSFIKTGKTVWLTNNEDEQFELHMFTPSELEQLVKARGFETISRIGKTVIPARKNKRFFEQEGSVERMVELETMLSKDPTALARASHVQVAARKMIS